MFLDVLQAKMNRGKTIPVFFTKQLEDNLIADYNARFLKDIEISGEYYIDDSENIHFECDLHLNLEFLCALCAKPIEKNFEIEVNETFTKIATDDGYSYSTNKVEIDQLVIDSVVLNMPYVVLCSDDCKGRCPICGIDKNVASCNCKPEQEIEQENPFSILQSLKK